jgi:uncharacterized protein (DUF885 family)
MTEKEKLEKLAEKYFAWAYKAFPVWATSKGIHQYDDSYSDLSKKGISQQLKTIKKFQKKLAEIDPEKLDVYSRSEYEILKGNFGWEILEYEKVRFFEKNPGFYLDEVVWGLFFLMTREFAPPEERAKNLLARLKKVPQVLGQGKRNIKSLPAQAGPPKVYTEVAIQTAEGALMLFRQDIPEFAKKAPKLEKKILLANKKAIKAVEDYSKFLKKLLPRSKGEYALGEELFEKKLSLAQQLEHSIQELLDLGWEVFRQTEKEMEAVGKEIDANKPWPEIVKKLRKKVPKKEELLETYEREVENLKKFLAKERVVPLPEEEYLKVMDTPHSERATTPYAAYLSPAPFEEDQTGQFWVTPIEKKLTVEGQERQLAEHALHHLPITVLHESYPGHHLQLVWANRHQSLVRKHGHNTPYCEGWALYCERLMEEVGYLASPEQRLFRLKDKLWRAARVILDVSLHTGQMGVEEAVSFLVEKVHLAQPSALSEVRRYTLTPTYPLSYLLGKLEILKLRDEVKEKLGEDFDLHEFHSQLLATGTIPIKLAKKEIIERIKK